MSDIINLINTAGFPAALVIILLFLLEVRMKEVIAVINKLNVEVSKCVTISKILVKDKIDEEGT